MKPDSPTTTHVHTVRFPTYGCLVLSHHTPALERLPILRRPGGKSDTKTRSDQDISNDQGFLVLHIRDELLCHVLGSLSHHRD
ncbi:hypothetical protein MC885_008805 [Smutsia gigantea]|nr:hypothetical protein MC885_008805 [Smutsia gigantea]